MFPRGDGRLLWSSLSPLLQSGSEESIHSDQINPLVLRFGTAFSEFPSIFAPFMMPQLCKNFDKNQTYSIPFSSRYNAEEFFDEIDFRQIFAQNMENF